MVEVQQQQQPQLGFVLFLQAGVSTDAASACSETQHGCRPDGNKQWFDKYLTKRKTLMKKTFTMDKSLNRRMLN